MPPANPVARKINREAVVLLGWGRAILLQLAHPLVAAGVADHSDFRAGASGFALRAKHTVGAMLSLTFGTDAEMRATADRINAIHDRTHGTLREAAGVFAAGTPYSARDPKLLAWVHATLLDSLPLAYETFAGPLTREEKDEYCAEATAIGPLLDIPPDLLPRNSTDLHRYLERMYRSGEIHVTSTAKLLARELLSPPIGPATRLFSLGRLATIGLLPGPVRRGYGFDWSTNDERSLRRWTAVLRRVRWLLPSMLREWPAARRR